MLNIYSFNDGEILVDAPGDSNINRIKNDLVWDINDFLMSQFDLYMFFVCNQPSNSAVCIPVSQFPRKYVLFQKLDNMFFQRTVLSDDEISYYREIMDPFKKMNDDVFRETCCIENVDVEYVAVEDINHLSHLNTMHRSIVPLSRKIALMFPIYISLFGSKEMRILINRSDLLKPIKDIVAKHCVQT